MALQIKRTEWLHSHTGPTGYLNWFLLHSMGNTTIENCVESGEVIGPKSEDRLDTIKLTFNGIELDITDCFKQLHDHHDAHVRSMAKQLLEEKYTKLSNALSRASDEIEQVFSEPEYT